MRVLHLTWLLSARGGGLPPAILRLAEAQRALGIDAQVVGLADRIASPAPREPWVQELEPLGPVILGWSSAARATLARLAPDLLHLHGLFTLMSWEASAWVARTGRPLVVSPHGMLSREALAISPLRKRLFRAMVLDGTFRRTACFHALGSHEVRDIRDQGLTTPIEVAPNGIVLEAQEEPRPGATADPVFPELAGRRVLLFLGRVHPIKGLASLVEAWAKARRSPASLDAWTLAIVGPDQLGHTAELQALATRLGVQDSVRLLGPVFGERKRRLLRDAAAFTLPSRSEASSIAVLEAMAERLPVLLTRTCNMDGVDSAGAGWVVGPGIEPLAQALRDLARRSPEELLAMGARARRCVEEDYTWPKIASAHVDVYRWLADQGPRPSCVVMPETGGPKGVDV